MQSFIGLTVRTVALIAIWRNVSELFDVSGAIRAQSPGCHALLRHRRALSNSANFDRDRFHQSSDHLLEHRLRN
jgi:hypothetical protein